MLGRAHKQNMHPYLVGICLCRMAPEVLAQDPSLTLLQTGGMSRYDVLELGKYRLTPQVGAVVLRIKLCPRHLCRFLYNNFQHWQGSNSRGLVYALHDGHMPWAALLAPESWNLYGRLQQSVRR